MIRNEKHPHAGLILNYAEDKNNQGYSHFVYCFQHSTKQGIHQNFIPQKEFITNNVNAAG